MAKSPKSPKPDSKKAPERNDAPESSDLDATIAGYRESFNVAVQVFGAERVAANPLIVFDVHDVTPDAIDEDDAEGDEALLKTLREERELMIAHVVGALAKAYDIAQQIEPSAEPSYAFGVYDRVFGDSATGDEVNFSTAVEIATKVFGGGPIDVIFEIFDREFGSPYEGADADDDAE